MTNERLEQGRKHIQDIVEELDDMVVDMDVKLNGVLKRQEQDYLKGYSVYVREKERELRDLILKINEKNQTN